MRHLWIGTFIVSLAGFGFGNASAATAGPQNPAAQLKICANTCLSSAKGDDDRATCRLQCRNEFEEAKLAVARATPPPKPVPRPAPAATPAATPAVTLATSPAPAKVRWTTADLTRCQSVCDHEALSTDRATCRLQCKAKVSEYSTATPQPHPPPRPKVGKAPQSKGYSPSGRLSADGPMVFSPTLPSTAPAARRALLEAEANKCKATCNRSGYRSNTDRETCKLTCDSKLDALPQGTVYHNAGASAEATRRAVIESSGGIAGGHSAAPPRYPAAKLQAPPATGTTPPAPASRGATKLAASPAPAQTCAAVSSCNRGCDNQQSLCTSSCKQENKRATDRATCKLTCTNNVEVCAEICASKVSMCQPKAAMK